MASRPGRPAKEVAAAEGLIAVETSPIVFNVAPATDGSFLVGWKRHEHALPPVLFLSQTPLVLIFLYCMDVPSCQAA
jgi:hypothetical protein